MVNIAKINLFKRDWIDTVFEDRNKEYGAYDLRRRESRITVLATVIGVVAFSLMMSAPVLMKKISASRGGGLHTIDKVVEVIELPPPAETPPEDLVVPPPPPEIKSIADVKRFVPPVAANVDEVVEEIVDQEVLKTAKSGRENVDASDDGEIVIEGVASDKTTDQVITEDRNIYNIKNVQVQPEYPGGMRAFIQFVIDNMGHISVEGSGNIKMQFGFVIEKNGKLTDIKVIDDGGYPDIAKLATNVLSWSTEWQPGVTNGKPVRVAYTLPMTIQIQ